MEQTINDRVKILRKSLKINQRDFSTLLSLSSSYIAGVEAKKEPRPVNDRLVKLISAQFNVNENWLRTGQGGIFKDQNDTDKSARLVSLFNDLPEKYQTLAFGIIELLRKSE
jgi:transcriptional regulator with XRE-family HTH domain